MKTIYDPPSDPYGHEKRCKICGTVMEFDKYNREFYCEKCEEELCPDCEGSGELAGDYFSDDGMMTCQRCGGKGTI